MDRPAASKILPLLLMAPILMAMLFTQRAHAQNVDLAFPLRDIAGKQTHWNITTDASSKIETHDRKKLIDKMVRNNPKLDSSKVDAFALDIGIRDENKRELKMLDPHKVEVVAAETGKVIEVTHLKEAGKEAGWQVKVRHEGGYTTVYTHIMVDPDKFKIGDTVERGSPIGLIANREDVFGKNSTKTESEWWEGPHLHFQVNIDDKSRTDVKLESREISQYKEGGWYASNLSDLYRQAEKAKQEAEKARLAEKTRQLADKTREAITGIKQTYSEPDNLSSTDRPKVIDTPANHISGSAVFSPSSGLAYLGTATGFGFRGEMPDTLESYDLGSTGSGRRGSATIVDQGSDASGGNLNWGRWSGAGSTNVAAGITYTGQNFHYVYGSAPANIPSSGSVTYNPVGGTSPTSSGGTNVAAGTAGTFNGGTIGVNFATRGVTVSNLNFTVSTATFNMNGSSTYNNNALFSGSLTGTCTGAACSGTVSGNHVGTLTGPAAAGIALGYQAHTTGTGMVVGAQGFKR